MKHPGPFVIDTDLNFPSDDAQALLLLARVQGDLLRGVSATAGNTFSEEVLVNLAALLAAIGRTDVPLARGRPYTEFAGRRDAALKAREEGRLRFVGSHGKAVGPRFSERDACELVEQFKIYPSLAALLAAQKDAVTLICLGPATAAKAALEDPEVARRVSSVWFMGGNLRNACEAPILDFNVWYDPEAAAQVVNCGVPITVVPYELSRSVRATPILIEKMRSAAIDPVATLVVEDFAQLSIQHGDSLPLCDQLLALLYSRPDLIRETLTGRLSVEHVSPSGANGYSRVVAGAGSARFVTAIDNQALREELLGILAAPAPQELLFDGEFTATSLYRIDLDGAFEPPDFSPFLPRELRGRTPPDPWPS